MKPFPLHRDNAGIEVGKRPAHPERTAVIEARGALLTWDEIGATTHPAAEIFDPDQAADWLWEVYGRRNSAAVLGDASEIRPDEPSTVLAAARRLAHIRWASRWWPASSLAGVPPLSAGLLAAEEAEMVFAVEHLLEDEQAVERALAQVDLGPVEQLTGDPRLGQTAADLLERVSDLADDYGVELPTLPSGAANDWALAAGGHTAGATPIASGSHAIDWTQIPPGLVDAAGRARWELSRRHGETVLTVVVPAAPRSSVDRPSADPPLFAQLGPSEVRLQRSTNAPQFHGSASAPSSVMLLPADRRNLQVYSPAMTRPRGVDAATAERQAEIISYAHRLAGQPDALLAVRAATGVGD